MKKLFAIVPLVLFLGLMGLLAVGLHKAEEEEDSILIGQPVPDFRLPDLFDKRQTIENLEGRPYIINVFASWCLPCRAELPTLMRLKSEGLPIIGINWKDNQKDATMWLAKWGNPYLAIGSDPKGELAVDLGISGVPETFVVDAQGKIVFHFTGPVNNAWQEEEIAKHFREPRS